MIVKVQSFKNDQLIVDTEHIYSDVKEVFKFRDKCDNIFLRLIIKGKEVEELIPITQIDDKGNYTSMIDAIWLMNDEGKTIEKII